MSKIFRTVGLLVLVAAFVFTFCRVSSAIMVADPDNETVGITTVTDVFVAVPVAGGNSFSETEAYSTKVKSPDNNTHYAKILYNLDVDAMDGETHATKTFKSVGNANELTPNLKVVNKVIFDAASYGLGGTITGTEKVELLRDMDEGTQASWCASCKTGVPAACVDVAMASSYTSSFIAADTSTSVTAISGSTLMPAVSYSISAGPANAGGEYAVGSVAAGMVLTSLEKGTTTEKYAQHTKASGLVKFSKTMDYKAINTQAKLPTNFSKVP
ncbi:MAG: hypothetical protein U9N18_07295 [Campylobacterota bacterium]|nr:hypothetical protein [Campylobacterota bacterium]